MFYWWWKTKGGLCLLLFILSGILLASYWIDTKKFNEIKNTYPIETIGTVENFQPTEATNLTCVPSESPYSAKYTVNFETHHLNLGCAPTPKLIPGNEIQIRHSKENPKSAIWNNHKEPSDWLIFGSITTFILAILIFFKGDPLFTQRHS